MPNSQSIYRCASTENLVHPWQRFPPKRTLKCARCAPVWDPTCMRLWNDICICKYSIVICTSGFLSTP